MQTEKTIGELIEYHVRKNKMSITDFAKKINCSRENVYKLIKKNDMSIQLLYSIGNVLNHNFFSDLAKDDTLIVNKEEIKMIKMKDLSDWLINFITETIHGMQIKERGWKKFNDWAKSFNRKEAEQLVWKNSLLELKMNGIEDDDLITIYSAKEFAMEIVQHVVNEWYLDKDITSLTSNNNYLTPYLSQLQEQINIFPKIIQEETIINLEQELNQKPKSELCGQKIEIPIWVRPDCFAELAGKAKIEFDNDCKIINFDFDTSECTL